ncbi:hypothetical protein BC827DRAFT_1105145, partial [Russula dissimulans]
LDMALLGSIPTHKHNVTKRWSRLDQVFLSDHSENMIITCNMLPDQAGINTDHLPIRTVLNLTVNTTSENCTPNFREVDWAEFRDMLVSNLSTMQTPQKISNQRQIDQCCTDLMAAIQDTICARVPVTNITTKSKHWWTKELTALCRKANKLGRQAFKCKSNPGHKIHAEHKEAARQYNKTLQYTKRQHWCDWLEKAEDPDIWMVSKLISSPVTD